MKELEELSLETTGGKGKVNASEGHFSSKMIFLVRDIENLFWYKESLCVQKTDITEEVESFEPPKPEKKKTRKGKKGGASPEDEEGDDAEGHVDGERNGEQKEKKKVK